MSKIEKNQELIMLKIKEVPKLSMGYMMSFWFCLDRYTMTNTKITWAFGSEPKISDLIITFNHLQSIGLDNLDIAASKFKSKI